MEKPDTYTKLLFSFIKSTWYKNSRIRSEKKRHTNPVEAGFPAELVGPRRAEVVVGPEGLVKCCDEVEQSLPATLVTQGVLPVLAALSQPGQDQRKLDVISSICRRDSPSWHYWQRRAGGTAGLGWGERLQDVWFPLLAELLEHVFVISCHLTGVALNPARQNNHFESHSCTSKTSCMRVHVYGSGLTAQSGAQVCFLPQRLCKSKRLYYWDRLWLRYPKFSYNEWQQRPRWKKMAWIPDTADLLAKHGW